MFPSKLFAAIAVFALLIAGVSYAAPRKPAKTST